MIAFVRMTLLRWLRRPLGVGLLIVPFIFTMVLKFVDERKIGSRAALETTIVLVVGTIIVSNQLASMIHEERRLGRLPILRVGGLDGWRAVACYAVVGLFLSVLFGAVAQAVVSVGGLTHGVSAPVWSRPVASAPVLLLAAVPAGIFGGIVLTRVLALTVLTVAGFLWGIAASPAAGDSPSLSLVTLGSLVALALMAPLWTRTADR
jgi:hypothetical protein